MKDKFEKVKSRFEIPELSSLESAKLLLAVCEGFAKLDIKSCTSEELSAITRAIKEARFRDAVDLIEMTHETIELEFESEPRLVETLLSFCKAIAKLQFGKCTAEEKIDLIELLHKGRFLNALELVEILNEMNYVDDLNASKKFHETRNIVPPKP